jgi:hypothetical protein
LLLSFLVTALHWNKNAVPGKPLKRKLPGTDEEEKREKNKRYEEH